MIRFLFLIITVCSSLPLLSQNILSVEEAVAKALQYNYDIQLVRNDSTSFAIDNKYAYGAFLPQLSGTATKVWNTNDQRQDFSDGTKRSRDGVKASNLNTAINLEWTLFDGLRMFATKQKLEEFQRFGGLSVKNQIVTTVANVIKGYYNVVQAKQSLKAILEQISISEERVKLADKKLSVGLGSKPGLLQARVDLNAQKAAQLRQHTLIAQTSETLNQLMGQPVNTAKFEVSDSIPINLDLQYGELANGLDSTNPALLLAKKNIDISKITLKEQKADLWPRITFNSAYNFSRISNNTVVNPFQPLFSQNKGYNFGFGATVPILTNFNTRRLIKQAQLDIRFQELTYTNQKSLVDVSLSNTYKDYEYQKQALMLEEDNIQLAKENVTIALARFKQGVSTYLELREAQISLADAYNRLIAARYNTKSAEVELLRIKGEIVK